MSVQLRGFALKFMLQGGIFYPVDPELHKLAISFAETAFSSPINFTDYETVLAVAEVDDTGKPTKVLALNCRIARWDYPVWRFTTDESGKVLIERTRAMLDDQGGRGGEVFVHIADKEAKESRCPHWRKFLRMVKAEKASRWRVRV